MDGWMLTTDLRLVFPKHYFYVNNSPKFIAGIFERFPQANMYVFPALITN